MLLISRRYGLKNGCRHFFLLTLKVTFVVTEPFLDFCDSILIKMHFSAKLEKQQKIYLFFKVNTSAVDLHGVMCVSLLCANIFRLILETELVISDFNTQFELI